MPEALKQHIQKFVSLTDDELATVLSFFTKTDLAKKKNLLVEGKVCDRNYFVASGCLRLFYVNDKGVEQTIQFALENWWLSDYTSFFAQQKSEFYIQTVERSSLFSIDFQSLERLLTEMPKMERYFRTVHQRAHAAYQFRIKYLYSLSREDLYHQFNKLYPDFVQRVPQYLLASYLGFTPEYLSEIRSRHFLKQV